MKQFEVDYRHSNLLFSVKLMKIAQIKGFFESYKAIISLGNIPDINNCSIYVEVDVASISTNDTVRDASLISADFFHADKYPKITFEAIDIEKCSENTYLLGGNLKIKETTKYVKFNVVYNGYAKSSMYSNMHGFTCTSSISRSEFGLIYNSVPEVENLLIDDKIEIHVELVLFE